MIRINLLPYRMARQRQQISQHAGNFFGIIVLAAVLSVGAHMTASIELADLNEEAAQLIVKNKELKKKVGKIEHLDALRTEVERKLKIVDRLQEGRFHSLITLNEMAQVIPKNVWLRSIKDNASEIVIEGLAESNKAVANFMRMLDQSSLFSNVKLQGISRVEVDGIPVRKFTLNLGRVAEAANGAGKAAVVKGKGAS
jgi:type IV pilus assembly protein PilN